MREIVRSRRAPEKVESPGSAAAFMVPCRAMIPVTAERGQPLRSDPAPPEVVAILVSHNSALHLTPCLASLGA
ncbi:MAG TPA: hypothetical protein VF363_09225, partial [Candidatus Eisenbacteria bacterium]